MPDLGRWPERRKARRAVLARLWRLGDAVEDVGFGGRRRVLLGATVAADERCAIAVTGSRAVQWDWDLDRERGRLAGCEEAVVAAWGGGQWRAVALRCGSRLCPVCFAARAGRAAHRWAPVVAAALRDGAKVWHVTLTQPQRKGDGSCVFPGESRRWLGLPPSPDDVRVAVAAESAFEAYERLMGSWRGLLSGRAGARVRRGAGFLRGVEWTLRPRYGPPRARPRWHCHMHVLLIGDQNIDPWDLVRRWLRLVPGASPSAQHVSAVVDEAALLEVLKYPFKPGELTIAGALDAWAGLRGSRTHQVGGCLHGRSGAVQRAEGPWAGWLMEAEDRDPWQMLWYRPRDDDRSPWRHVTASHMWRGDGTVLYRLGGGFEPGSDGDTVPPALAAAAMAAMEAAAASPIDAPDAATDADVW